MHLNFPSGWDEGKANIHLNYDDEEIDLFVQLCEDAGYSVFAGLKAWIKQCAHPSFGVWCYRSNHLVHATIAPQGLLTSEFRHLIDKNDVTLDFADML